MKYVSAIFILVFTLFQPIYAAGLVGSELSLKTIFQSTPSSSIHTIGFLTTAIVAEPRVEFPSLQDLDVDGDGLRLVDVAINAGNKFIEIDFTNVSLGRRFARAHENTYVFTFESDVGVNITDAEIDPQTTLGLEPSDVRFTGGELFVNVEGLLFNTSTYVKINLVIENKNPNEVITRRDMARGFLEKLNVIPPLASGHVYGDVQLGDINANWIEKFSADGYTEGCANNKFCPKMVVTRESLAKIFLKVKNGAAHAPYSSSTQFIDVLPGSFNAVWINELGDNAAFTAGCAPNRFCPKEPVTRKWFDTLLRLLP